MNDMLRHSLLKLSDTRRSALVQRVECIEWSRNDFLAQLEQMEEELAAIEKELHRLDIIETDIGEL